MKIGLVDVDGHNFPNLALMRISSYHKAKGDDVEWWWSDFIHYDIVYMSKIFSDVYSPDVPEPLNADKVIKGGTGYAIRTVGGKEIFDKSKDVDLPPEIEKSFPDYSIYPQFPFAVSMTSRGCPRDLMRQYRDTGAYIDFTQGIDIRLVNDDDIADLNAMRIKEVHFAWDNPTDDLAERFRLYAEQATHKPHGRYGTVYVLTNYNSTMEENLYRIYTLRDLGYDPYVMIYNKPSAPKEIRHLQRWCNNKIIFKSVKRFEDYMT